MRLYQVLEDYVRKYDGGTDEQTLFCAQNTLYASFFAGKFVRKHVPISVSHQC